MKTKKLIYLVLFFIPVVLSAQWSNDPMVNTLIAGTDIGEQALPKIAVNNDGSYYISSFVDVGPPVWYNVYLHKLDANGNKLWDEDGLLVSDHNNRSWYSDYNLVTGQENSAILTFADIREGTGFTNIYGYRISTSGDFLWGNDGVTLSDNLFDEYSPKAIVTDQGNYIFAWHRAYNDSLYKYSVVIQKVSSEGQLVWDNEVELINSDTTYCEPFLVPAENDNFIAVWCRMVKISSGSYFDYYKYIYAQKFDADGNEVWPDIVAVCDLDTLANLLPYYVTPVVESDNNNGVFVSWFDCRLDHCNLHTYVQHIDTDGNTIWPENGVITSLNYGQFQVEADIEYIPASDELFVFWQEYSYITFEYGMSGQKISNSGQRMWGDNGQVFEPLSLNPYISFCYINAKLSPENDIVVIYQKDSLYISPPPPDTIVFTYVKAMRVNEAGQFVWDDEKVFMSSYLSWKINMDVCDFANNQLVAVWIDDRPDLFWPEKLYAQNIQLDGELGPSVSTDNDLLTLKHSLKNYPNPFNPSGAGRSPSTTIKFTIPADEKVKLSIYNIKGQLIKTLIDETQIAGEHTIFWNGKNNADQPVSSGIYFYKMETKNISQIKKCLLLK